MKSLRGQLVFFWVLLFAVCVGLGTMMVTLYRSSAGAQVAEGRAQAEQSCRAIAARYAKSVPDPAPAACHTPPSTCGASISTSCSSTCSRSTCGLGGAGTVTDLA